MDFSSGDLNFNIIPLWSWFLIMIRCIGVVEALPGVGTQQVPGTFRLLVTIGIATCLSLSGIRAPLPSGVAEMGLMTTMEFFLGYALGLIPSLVISGVGVAGQVTTGSIGLGQANMIDPSLGVQVAVLARIQTLIATIIFLLIDGHHAVIRAATGLLGDIGLGAFRPSFDIFYVIVERLSATFELAVMVAAPILVTILVTNFVLALITKFVPQVNIFIISLPLTIIVGLYIVIYTFTGLSDHLITFFHESEFTLLRLVTAQQP